MMSRGQHQIGREDLLQDSYSVRCVIETLTNSFITLALPILYHYSYREYKFQLCTTAFHLHPTCNFDVDS